MACQCARCFGTATLLHGRDAEHVPGVRVGRMRREDVPIDLLGAIERATLMQGEGEGKVGRTHGAFASAALRLEHWQEVPRCWLLACDRKGRLRYDTVDRLKVQVEEGLAQRVAQNRR